MAKINWAKAARDDLKIIFEYIAQDSPEMANTFVKEIIESTRKLERLPLIGYLINHPIYRNARQILYGNYRIIYKTSNNKVEIMAVVHVKRRF